MHSESTSASATAVNVVMMTAKIASPRDVEDLKAVVIAATDPRGVEDPMAVVIAATGPRGAEDPMAVAIAATGPRGAEDLKAAIAAEAARESTARRS